MIRASSRILTGAFIALGIQFSAQASDQGLLESARSSDSGQAWFTYLTQCTDCDNRQEALGQLQLKQFESNGQLQIEGAAAGTAGSADTGLLEQARETNAGQDWYNYLSQCGSCEARGEALGALQNLQLEAGGNLALDAVGLSGSGGSGALGQPSIDVNSGDETTLADQAFTNGTAQAWYSYLVGCTECSERNTALNAMQQLQFASNGQAFTSDASWAPGESLIVSDETEAQQDFDATGTNDDEDIENAGAEDGAETVETASADQEASTEEVATDSDPEFSYDDASENSSADADELADEVVAATAEATSEATNEASAAAEQTTAEATAAKENLAGGDIEFSAPAGSEAPSPEELMADTADSGFDSEQSFPEENLSEESFPEETFAEQSLTQQTSRGPGFDSNAPEGNSWELALEISGHSRAVWRVAFSPVAPLLASASGDRTVLLYDLNARDVSHRLTAHQGYVNAVSFSPDGKLLASGGGDHAIIIWDVATGAALRILQGHSGDINALAWSASGDLLVSGADDGRVLVWNSETGKRTAEMAETGSDVTSIAISPDEATIAAAGSDGHVYLFDSSNGQQTGQLDSHDGYTFDLAWDVNGKNLTGAGSDGVIRQWTIGGDSAPSNAAEQPEAITGIDFSANGKYIASSSFDGGVVIRDADSFETIQTIPAYPGSAYSVSMTGDGRFVAAAGGLRFIRVWRK